MNVFTSLSTSRPHGRSSRVNVLNFGTLSNPLRPVAVHVRHSPPASLGVRTRPVLISPFFRCFNKWGFVGGFITLAYVTSTATPTLSFYLNRNFKNEF